MYSTFLQSLEQKKKIYLFIVFSYSLDRNLNIVMKLKYENNTSLKAIDTAFEITRK